MSLLSSAAVRHCDQGSGAALRIKAVTFFDILRAMSLDFTFWAKV